MALKELFFNIGQECLVFSRRWGRFMFEATNGRVVRTQCDHQTIKREIEPFGQGFCPRKPETGNRLEGTLVPPRNLYFLENMITFPVELNNPEASSPSEP